MPRAGFSRSGGYRRIQKGWGEGQLYGLQLSDGVYKGKKVVSQEGGGVQKLGELSDVDLLYAAPGGFTRWRLLGAGGSPLRTPFKKQAGLWTSKFHLLMW